MPRCAFHRRHAVSRTCDPSSSGEDASVQRGSFFTSLVLRIKPLNILRSVHLTLTLQQFQYADIVGSIWIWLYSIIACRALIGGAGELARRLGAASGCASGGAAEARESRSAQAGAHVSGRQGARSVDQPSTSIRALTHNTKIDLDCDLVLNRP